MTSELQLTVRVDASASARPSANRCAELLERLGARSVRHGRGRTLYQHLLETSTILGVWAQPLHVREAGALHSVYGTDVFRGRLLGLERRAEIRALVGEQGERLVYLFAVLPRADVFATFDRAGRIPDTVVQLGDERVTPDEFAELLILQMANHVEQACDADGAPAHWVSRVLHWGRLLRPGRDIVPPIVALAAPSDAEEQRARTAYARGLALIDTEGCGAHFAEASASCRALAEPKLWSAYLQLCTGERAAARSVAAEARGLLECWASPWDKRLSLSQWRELCTLIERSEPSDPAHLPRPRAQQLPLFLTQLRAQVGAAAANGPMRDSTGAVAPRRAKPPDERHSEPLPARFSAYVSQLFRDPRPAAAVLYPGLEARPWHDAAGFPIVAALERHFSEIRSEAARLSDVSFQVESESIRRVGSWEVAFLYECGKRNDEICASMPMLTAIVESHATVRSASGLIYVSRLRKQTAIRSHYGPSNLRLRCHLALEIPDRSCGISVNGEARSWTTGRCLVFDDSFHHHAWNHSDQDRMVVVIDLWHPGLSEREIELLSGLQRFMTKQAGSLNRYYASNARARRAAHPEYH